VGFYYIQDVSGRPIQSSHLPLSRMLILPFPETKPKELKTEKKKRQKKESSHQVFLYQGF
jgi:hypothetical protein